MLRKGPEASASTNSISGVSQRLPALYGVLNVFLFAAAANSAVADKELPTAASVPKTHGCLPTGSLLLARGTVKWKPQVTVRFPFFQNPAWILVCRESWSIPEPREIVSPYHDQLSVYWYFHLFLGRGMSHGVLGCFYFKLLFDFFLHMLLILFVGLFILQKLFQKTMTKKILECLCFFKLIPWGSKIT